MDIGNNENLGKRGLVVFDFDWSMIDDNSDTFIFEKLSPEIFEKAKFLSQNVQWTDLMDQLLGELYDLGIKQQEIECVMGELALKPEMVQTLNTIKQADSDIIILSDANTVYIDLILKANKVDHLISYVVSNPATWDDDGRLRVQRFHPADTTPHGCPNPCALNICKGTELTRYLTKNAHYNKVIYVGDSTNDFCPATKMTKTDLLLARKNCRLERFLNNASTADAKVLNSQIIEARIVYWNDASDVLKSVSEEFDIREDA